MTTLREYLPGLLLTELTLDEFDVRGALVVGKTGVMIWDTLSCPEDMAPVREILDEDQPFSVVYSHADWDHVWGTSGLPAGPPIIAHDAARIRFRKDVPLTLEQMRAEQPGQWADVVLVPPTVTFPSALTLDLGGVTAELFHLPGHTPDCLVAFLPEWGVLLAGDTVETPFPIVNEGTALTQWRRGLQHWADDERVHTVIPSHGEIGNRELIRRNVAYLGALADNKPLAAIADVSPFYEESHRTNLERARRTDTVVRPATASDLMAVRQFVIEEWGSEQQVMNGEIFSPHEHPGFIAERAGAIIGYASYRINGDTCELLLLNSIERKKGTGRCLVETVAQHATAQDCRRVVVVTTNDNLDALGFYQRCGFVLRTVRAAAVTRSRALKPAIPAIGQYGVPIRDEIELELDLS